MDELVTWIRAQLDEEEQVARAATDGPWSVDDENYAETIYAADGHTTVVAGGRWGGEASVFTETADALHIARFNPARVLAKIAATRWVLDLHRVDDAGGLDPICNVCLYTPPCETIRALALPYADQHGYREEWRL